MGVHKALSAAEACRALNSSIQVEAHLEGMTPTNAVHLVEQYDVVVDASDNAPTRYLIRCCAWRPGRLPTLRAAMAGRLHTKHSKIAPPFLALPLLCKQRCLLRCWAAAGVRRRHRHGWPAHRLLPRRRRSVSQPLDCIAVQPTRRSHAPSNAPPTK